MQAQPGGDLFVVGCYIGPSSCVLCFGRREAGHFFCKDVIDNVSSSVICSLRTSAEGQPETAHVGEDSS